MFPFLSPMSFAQMWLSTCQAMTQQSLAALGTAAGPTSTSVPEPARREPEAARSRSDVATQTRPASSGPAMPAWPFAAFMPPAFRQPFAGLPMPMTPQAFFTPWAAFAAPWAPTVAGPATEPSVRVGVTMTAPSPFPSAFGPSAFGMGAASQSTSVEPSYRGAGGHAVAPSLSLTAEIPLTAFWMWPLLRGARSF